jgi:YgiT-type zinc finger domain-containing protein
VEILFQFDKEMIALCGINCGTCMAYLREKKNRCHGCRHADLNIPVTRQNCKIKNCEHLPNTESKLCSDCHLFPCARLRQIDKRYRTRYKTSLIRNLDTIKEIGLENFIVTEVRRWSCPNCGSVLSVHKDFCLKCNFEVNRESL